MNFVTRREAILPILYCLWAAIAIGLSIALNGLSPENVTRLLVIAFLLGQVALRSVLVKAFPRLSPRTRFIALGTLLAAVVEGFHMISMPVFPSLRVGPDTPLDQGLIHYLVDLLVTVPAYLIILSVIWYFIDRYNFTLWRYIVVMGFAQALGDGGLLYFLGAPAMIVFLPYPMTNYHAINVIPFLAVRDHLRPRESSTRFTYLAIPAVMITYFVCGAVIRLAGRALRL